MKKFRIKGRSLFVQGFNVMKQPWRIQELGPARVWRGVGRSSRRGRPGEGAGGEGGTPPAQLGGLGERCKLPHRGLGRSPRSQRFLRRKPPKKTRGR